MTSFSLCFVNLLGFFKCRGGILFKILLIFKIISKKQKIEHKKKVNELTKKGLVMIG